MSDEMNWQPCRWRSIHIPISNTEDSEILKEISKKVIRITPGIPSKRLMDEYKFRGCDSLNFFLVHPEDARVSFVREFVCEHEIITD